MGVITQGLWLCYRAPTPIASADVKASLFRCASAAVRVAGSGGAACVAQPLVPFIRAELEGLYGDLQAGSERRANSGGGSSFATAAAALSALEAVLAACGDLLPAATQEEVAHLMAVLLRSPAPGALGSAVSRCAALCSVSCAGALVALLPMAGMAVAGVSACDSVAAREALYAGAMCEGSIHPRVSPVCVAPPVSRRTTTPVTTTDDVVVDDDSTVRFSHSASTPATAIVGTVFAGQKPEYKPLEFASTTTTSSSSTAAAATVTNASVTENKSKECDKSTHLNDTASMLEFLNPKPAKSFSIVVPEHEHDEPEPKPEPEDKHEEESMGIVACNNSEAVEEKEAKVKEGNKVVIAIREEESVVMEDHEPEIKKQKTETVPKSQPQLDVAELALMDVGPDEEDEDLDDDDDDEFN